MNYSKNKPYKTVSARAMEDTKVIKLPFGAFKVCLNLNLMQFLMF